MMKQNLMVLRSKLKRAKKDNKGFTLVELIVVIVILAILAAILIPGLLKWIDKAKEEQYTLEARNIYLATQAEIAKAYAAGGTKPTSFGDGGSSISGISELSDLSVTSVSVTYSSESGKEWEITTLNTVFKSANGKTINATMTGNQTWVINSITG